MLAVVGLLTYGLVSKGSGRLSPGDEAPALSLDELEGDGVGSLAEYRGKWVLVNFWASWCVPCRDEAPALEAFQRRHAGEDFTVLGIDTKDISEDGRAFVDEYGLSYPQLHDGDGDAADEFGTTGVPENFLVDPTGKVRLVPNAGPVDERILREEVAPLIESRDKS